MEPSVVEFHKLDGCANPTLTMALRQMKMGIIFVLASVCFLAPVHRAQPPSATISDLSFRNMDFAMNLYRKISSYHDHNVFFSPLSISSSFAALLMASDGVTHRQIIKGLNLEELEQEDQPELIPELFQLLQENITRNGSLRLDQGLGLFAAQHFGLEDAFKEQVKRFFDADIQRVDFANTRASVRLINDYIKRKTQNKVTDMISSVDADTRLMLINTIFFQGSWLKPFDSNFTVNAPFYIDNYNVVQVPMMYLEDKFYMMVDVPLGAQVLKLPYREGVSMLVLLPNKGVDYTTIDDHITAEKFLSWTQRLRKTKLEINMPKFKMVESYSLHKLLPGMGMRSLFSSAANLTRLSKDEGLRVSEVLHEAVIEVDETGTAAAAATAVGIMPYSLPRTFIINRPFFFFIYHEDTNCLLFMGRVINPNKN